METKTFVIATNGRLKWWFHHTLEDLSPEQLDYHTPLVDDRPIAEVAMHASVILLGNAPSLQPGSTGTCKTIPWMAGLPSWPHLPRRESWLRRLIHCWHTSMK
jgi:hypothetical protein